MPHLLFYMAHVSNTVHSEKNPPLMQAVGLPGAPLSTPAPMDESFPPSCSFALFCAKLPLTTTSWARACLSSARPGNVTSHRCHVTNHVSFGSCVNCVSHSWQLRLPKSTAKLHYPCMADGPKEHLGLDIVQDLRCKLLHGRFCCYQDGILDLVMQSPSLASMQPQDSSKGFDAHRWVPQLHAAAALRTLLCADDEALSDIIGQSKNITNRSTSTPTTQLPDVLSLDIYTS